MDTEFVTTNKPAGALQAWRGVLLGGAALVLVGLFASLQVSTWRVRLRYPGEYCEVEGMRLAEMQHLRRGIPIYAPATDERFDAAIYGPLYYLLGSRLIDPKQPAYFPLRLAAALWTLGGAAVAGCLAYSVSRLLLAALLAPLIFLSYGFVTYFGVSDRADSGALFLVFSGVLIAHRFQQRGKILLAAPLFLLAFFYKQQFVAAPLATVLFLVSERRYKLAAAFAGLMIAGGAGLLALFQFGVFHGQDFFLHFFNYNLVPFALDRLKAGAIVFGMILLIPLLVGFESLRVYRDRFLGWYVAAAVVLALVGVAKDGSDMNYLLECIFIFSVLFAALLASRIGSYARTIELLILLVVPLFVAQLLVRPAPGKADFAKDEAIQSYLRRSFAPGTRALGFYTGDLLRAGLEVPFTDLYQYSQLLRRGVLSDEGVVEQLRRQEFGVVVVTYDLQAGRDKICIDRQMGEGVRRAILQHYRLATARALPSSERIHFDDRFYAWVPREGL